MIHVLTGTSPAITIMKQNCVFQECPRNVSFFLAFVSEFLLWICSFGFGLFVLVLFGDEGDIED